MTSSTARNIGKGAFVTLAGAASLAFASGAANACDTKPPTHGGGDHDHNCTVDRGDVQYAAAGKDGKPAGAWQTDATHFHRLATEPVNGIALRLDPKVVTQGCTGDISVSLASYTAEGPTWETSGKQAFVGYSTTKLSTKKDKNHDVLTVKLPGAEGKPCFGQIDLYFGSTIFDGGKAAGHGPLPHYPDRTTPSGGLIAAWNGADSVCGSTTPPPPPTTNPPTTNPPPSNPSTPPTSNPTTPTSHPTTPPTAKATNANGSPGTPSLAETGANVGSVSLIALAFFGAGGTALVAGRKKLNLGARKH